VLGGANSYGGSNLGQLGLVVVVVVVGILHFVWDKSACTYWSFKPREDLFKASKKFAYLPSTGIRW